MSSQIVQLLMQINAIKLSPQNPFTWASGIKSPIYCDNRITLSFPEIRNQIVEEFVNLCNSIGPIDCIAGVATAGIPHGMLLADRLNKPFVYVRDKPKAHGKQNQIEGKLDIGSNVLVIEDLISTGQSSINAVEVLREYGVKVEAVFAIFDYNFEVAKENFEKIHCKYYTITNYNKLLTLAKETKQFDEATLDLLSKWRNNPKDWLN
jgi:orotate phosphoribosyltransferase